MEKSMIMRRLHHRPPYLLIDKVIEHDNKTIMAESRPTPTDDYLKGHFPGSPVVPGAMMQEMTTQTAGLLITEYYSPVSDYNSEVTRGWALGVLRTIHGAKYRSFARPGDILRIKVELLENVETSFRFKGRIYVGDQKIMTNEFTLVNIEESKLTGI